MSSKGVEKALASEGRLCIIFGERGVGKASLAETAYRQNFSEIGRTVLVGCEETSTFSSIMRAIIEKRIDASQTRQGTSWKAKFGIKTGIFNAEIEKQISEEHFPEITDVNGAIRVLDYLKARVRRDLRNK